MKRDQNAPTYEGRSLPRPDGEVVDQGLSFDIGMLMSRRRILRILGVGAATAGLAACASNATGSSSTSSTTTAASSSSSASGEIPEETAGPYPGDGSNGPDVVEQRHHPR